MSENDRSVLAFDPSIQNLGYALLSEKGVICNAGIIRQETSKAVDYHARGYFMASMVKKLAETMLPEADLAKGLDVVIEAPANWLGGRGEDSKNDEAVQKLYYQVGCLIGVLTSLPVVKGIWSVLPGQWKGQATKDVMKARCVQFAQRQSVNLPLKMPHDTAEAILLARYALKMREPDDREVYQQPMVCIHRAGDIHQGTFSIQDFIDSGDEDLVT